MEQVAQRIGSQSAANGELLDLGRLQAHARSLAHDLRVPRRAGLRGNRSHLRRLTRQMRLLADVYTQVADDVHRGEPISPSAEWLLDNFHLITNEVRSIRNDLPPRYYRRLPRIAPFHASSSTRIETLAAAIIAHSDGRLDAERLQSFLRAFQSVTALTMGELWAWPSVLKLTLVGYLSGLAERIKRVREDCSRAETLVAGLTAVRSRAGRSITGDTSLPFVVRLLQHIREYGPEAAALRAELEEWLAAKDLTAEDAIRIEGQREAADQVSMANAITSLRLCASLDWSRFFESVSHVEQILQRDPVGVYGQMDFRTRDQYRHAVEELGGGAAEAQVRVALDCVETARQAATGPLAAGDRRDRRTEHVGYYLIGPGRSLLETRHRSGRRVLRRVRQFVERHPTFVYLTPIALITAALVFGALYYATTAGASVRALPWIFVLVLIAASELALSTVQWMFARLLIPRHLPRLDLARGVPEQGRTMVIVPTLFGSVAAVDDMLAHLEVQSLANLDPRIHFAILSDFPDADARDLPGDRAILEAARNGVTALNARHSHGRNDRFYLFHRERRWNPAEGRWMGWERKRGKIDEFNRFLRAAGDTSFTELVGDLSILPAIVYCITLDSDTRLPRDAAKALIGIALHPLNQPQIDPARRIVTEGYGILQPRVSVTMASAAGSLFARVYAGHTGVDPYTTAVSDTYQDLFGEGIYAGKGLFHVDVFRSVLEGRIPDNALLSHDLFESLHARAALVSDVEVVDDYPATVLAHARRQQRWVRGDWQILLWLFPWVPTRRRTLERNQLSLISRWKILDNLRRSLVAPSLVALFTTGWTILPGNPIVWTVAALAVIDSPLLFLLPRVPAILWRRPWTVVTRRLWDDVKTTTAQVTLSLVLLVYHAWEALHGIVVTLVRLLVTQRRLLEWETAASVAARVKELTGRGGLRRFEVEMASSPLFALALLFMLRNAGRELGLTAFPFIAAWLLAPIIAYWLSQPVAVTQWQFTAEDRRRLRLWARRTWSYYEAYMGAEDHWLPPDNMQEEYGPRVAHRTSPTNIGMSLLATMAAHDLGYLSTDELSERIERTLDTIEGLEDYEGHLLNWYDTTTLAPLYPKYVSTVDSGNLTAALLTLASGFERLRSQPQTAAQLVEGLADTADVLRAAVVESRREHPASDLMQTLESVARDLSKLFGAHSRPEASNRRLADCEEELEQSLSHGNEPLEPTDDPDALRWARLLLNRIRAYRTPDRVPTPTHLSTIADRCRALSDRMHFGFLYDRSRHLFSIGYRLADAEGPGRLDASYYDLLASESRLASFLAIANGDVPQEHWFHLGRLAVSLEGVPTLVSWSATMFEYLMPVLLMRVFPETLLDQTCRRVVRRQMQYAAQLGVPWGMSESAYAVVDRTNTYQYKAFGVPGLGLKRGLADDLVVTPYATALALPFEPALALDNLERLAKDGVAGRFGFYEAIDFSSRRRPDEDAQSRDAGVVVRTVMAHHQGMILVALTNALQDNVMVERFHADSRVQATELLLQERVPRQAAAAPPRPAEESRAARTAPLSTPRRFRTPHTYYPHAQVLSNGSYALFVTNAGGGGSRWHDLAVTRWRDDRTSDSVGQALYLRDVRSEDVWSATYQPTCREPDDYLVTFSSHRVVFRRTDFEIETQLDIAVAPEDDTEVRRLSITNHSERSRELEITSYAEVVLAPQATDLAHPAFGQLFVETEYLPDTSALLCGRRPRGAHDPGAWLFHVLSVEGRTQAPTEWETSRPRFLGRGRSPADPIALDGRPLSGTTGAVLDPVVSLRQRLRLPPGGFVRLSFATGAAADRETAKLLAQKYHDRPAASRAFAMAYTHSQMWFRHLGVTTDAARQFDRLASRVFGLDDSLCASADTLARNERGQYGLWPHSISGDLPIVLVRVMEDDDLALTRQVLQAQEYWRLQGLRADIVILNEHPVSYFDEIQEQLIALLERGPWAAWKDRPGGVYLLRSDGLNAADRIVLQAAARAVLTGDRGELVHQLDRPSPPPTGPVFKPRVFRGFGTPPSTAEEPHLQMSNGLGGFADGGREYAVMLRGQDETPAPWANVLANPIFGTLVTASGATFTWSENSRENRLTPFANDAVTDPTGEAIYLRDETSGATWGATPGPLPRSSDASWIVRHGAGYVRFERPGSELIQSLDVWVSPTDPVKLSLLTITNQSAIAKRIAVFHYAEWALGPPREGHRRHVVTDRDEQSGAILARNRYREEWNDRLAFVWSSDPPSSVTGDRIEFLGRHGSLSSPRALTQPALSNQLGAGLDPCAALKVDVTLEPGASEQLVFLLGEGRSIEHVRELIARHAGAREAERSRHAVQESWQRLLGAIQVHTPDDSFDLILNGWLLYQSVSARLWGRTGFYQPGGAFGFRDQLQDVMALVYSRPDLYRQHLIYCAGRQFIEGDVQHWWDPATGKGIRSTCSDDMLWLPYAVAQYVSSTGDTRVLDEMVPFLDAPALAPGEIERYVHPTRAQAGSLFEHCVRAIERGLTAGAHGLPLIGGGDWNDGFNQVGPAGRGESVWVGWFLYKVLTDFARLADARADGAELAARFRTEARRLAGALELAWDGEWYRRAYFDDGRPLGSAHNDECKIDSIAQSWAVLSGAAPAHRTERAMDAARSHLVRRDAQVVLLLTPPFDRSELAPGYIKGYIPGIRENGGQYTHAALWLIMALARLGYGDEAMELFHMMNPINRTRDAAGVQRYAVEPYVVAADVYAHPAHAGRGGWTWYTGSASWMYRVGIEGILGLQRRGATFAMAPCIPAGWPACSIRWQYGQSRYEIEVDNTARRSTGVARVELDGREVPADAIPLVDDGRTHLVRVVMGPPPVSTSERTELRTQTVR